MFDRSSFRHFALGLGVAAAAVGLASCCEPPPAKTPGVATAVAAPPPAVALNQIPRQELNQLAARLALPLLWEHDNDGNKTIDAAELAVLWGLDKSRRGDWVDEDGFSARFYAAYEAMLQLSIADLPIADLRKGDSVTGLDQAEVARRALVRKELSQGRPALVRNSFVSASEQDSAIVKHVLAAAKIIEELHAMQIGSSALRKLLADGDPASRMLFYRNQGPWCAAPATEKDPSCNAIASLPKRISGLYPAALQADPAFCDKLKDEPNGEKLRHQFHVVRGKPGALEAVPYTVAYGPRMKAIAKHLIAAANAISSSDEKPFKTYLATAAQAFLDNNWEPADEAWAKMNAQNSKWYLRIGPDEVYFEPCNLKAGFHVSFALINQDSLRWQRKLDPVKTDMEKVIAELAGPPYVAREVSFHLPDFIDIVLNAGDSRSSHGATIGQSLPNWGPVANEGRGRTVAMTNLYTDSDSQAEMTTQAESLLCPATMAKFDATPEPGVMATVLHEAAHNLGPAHEYKVDGKKAGEIFGGPMASTLEELKAQTASLFLTDWLVERGVIDRALADRAHVRDITWAFGHISRGMYTATKKPKSYSQLAAIQLGFLVEHGAVQWRAELTAANKQDQGCLEIHTEKFAPLTKKLMKISAGIKARGDLAGAKQLKASYVDVDGDKKKLLDTIRERWLRAPKATFVYSIER